MELIDFKHIDKKSLGQSIYNGERALEPTMGEGFRSHFEAMEPKILDAGLESRKRVLTCIYGQDALKALMIEVRDMILVRAYEAAGVI